MPTLQRYKKEYQRRLRAVGKGRTQRYRPESLDTFREIKKENLKKRGRPRKSDYRSYNIKSVEGPDDYASIAEAVTRRYRRLSDTRPVHRSYALSCDWWSAYRSYLSR